MEEDGVILLSESYDDYLEIYEAQVYSFDVNGDGVVEPVPLVRFTEDRFTEDRSDYGRPVYAICIFQGILFVFEGYHPWQIPDPNATRSRAFPLEDVAPNTTITPNMFFNSVRMSFPKQSPISFCISDSEILVFGVDVSFDTETEADSRVFEILNVLDNRWMPLPAIPHTGCVCGGSIGGRRPCTCYSVIAHSISGRNVFIKTGNGSFVLDLDARQWHPWRANINQLLRGFFLEAETNIIFSDGERVYFNSNEMGRNDIGLPFNQTHTSLLPIPPFLRRIVAHGTIEETSLVAAFLRGKTVGQEARLWIDRYRVVLSDNEPGFIVEYGWSFNTTIRFNGTNSTLT